MHLDFYNPFSTKILMTNSNIKPGIVTVKIQSGLINRLLDRWKTYEVTYIDTNHGDSRNIYYVPYLVKQQKEEDHRIGSMVSYNTWLEKYPIKWNSRIKIVNDVFTVTPENLDLINHNLNVLKVMNNV